MKHYSEPTRELFYNHKIIILLKTIPLNKIIKMFPQDVHREVCYASLYIPKRGNQRTKSNPLPNPDFSVYNDIKMHT